MNKALTPFLLGWILFCAANSFAGEVRVRLDGIQEARGEVRAALFDSREAYESNRQKATAKAPARLEGIGIVFADVEPGLYCISVYQDLDGDGEIDKNFVGAPKEPYGHSHNARGRFGPPPFDEISFVVGSEPVNLEIELH